MKHNVVTPSVGESVTEVSILKWNKKSGDQVKVGEVLLELESDKASVEVVADYSGQLTITQDVGARVPIGEIVATIDDSVKGTDSPAASAKPAAPKESAPASGSAITGPAAVNNGQKNDTLSPAVNRLVQESGANPSDISGTGRNGRITKGDVIEHLEGGSKSAAAAKAPAPAAPKAKDRPGDRRVPMPNIRQKIAERLVYSQKTAAILTTFNEVDMKPVMDIRAKYKDKFKDKYGVPLSFMSFFTRASIEALKVIPGVNASIDGTDIVYHDYYDIGIAVGTDRGLVVPVIRDVGNADFQTIEKKIGEMATKAKNGKLSIPDMSGGTFTISNGGTYGSLLSTPIINPPQSGILGMHKIMDRPVAIDGKVEIRPMMYLALSYDHRLIDGKEAVTFLVTMKDFLENPEKLKMGFVNEL
jgi:2-oxoglutarate dehydrogenase E2 component (dihydrolipoamide succinyltransferase)